MADRDPAKYFVRFSRARVSRDHHCSLCSVPVRHGVKAQLQHPAHETNAPFLLVCDDCADAIGDLAFDRDAKPVNVPVGGICFTVPVDVGRIDR